MTDKMTETWMQQLYWSGSEEELFEKWKGEFVQKTEAARLWDLNAVNQWLGNEDKPTREHASLLSKQRELESWHRKLKALGR